MANFAHERAEFGCRADFGRIGFPRLVYSLAPGRRSVPVCVCVCVVWRVVCVVWRVVCGVWCVVCGVWCVVSAQAAGVGPERVVWICPLFFGTAHIHHANEARRQVYFLFSFLFSLPHTPRQ